MEKSLLYNFNSSYFTPDYGPKEYSEFLIPFSFCGKNKCLKTLYRKDYTLILKLTESPPIVSICIDNLTATKIEILFSIDNKEYVSIAES